ncbi:type II secretion system protein GspM [Candidatus Thiodubiliella endoseptemdiera]|uniref:Type II secretion system protein M n=1 Tax=Candidatus Thiodubiliella endoseptemdiera TaxID=2738886 RepID=A0A853F2G3_9GAMM|nr:type II secretion system protein M [Candidatus Thiodubiliella endoseptemdiera]
MNWHTLNSREKNSAIIVAIIFIIALLYALVFSPIWQHNEQLQLELEAEKNLATYLQQTQQKLVSLPNYPTLSQQQAEQYINQTFKAQRVQLNGVIMQPKKSIVSINKITFKKLLNSLKTLKNKYGILTVKANIKRIKSGIVDAQLTLNF